MKLVKNQDIVIRGLKVKVRHYGRAQGATNSVTIKSSWCH
jgi:hypothetical protein